MIKNLACKKIVKNLIAGMLVICMAALDLSLLSRIPTVEYEEHEMESYLADGNYNGTDSSYEISNGSDDEFPVYEDIFQFNILEIIPAEGLASIGYSIEGFEPVPGNDAEEKHAYMDALGNTITGDQNLQPSSTMNNVITQFADGEKKPFDFKKGKYTGYYKYVGAGNGYYSIYNNSLDRSSHTVKMISKFYNNGNGENDYIWVDTSKSFDELLNSDSVDQTKDIVVKNHWKFKYENYDIFLGSFYTPQSYNSGNGNYSGSTKDAWKETHKIDLRTRLSSYDKLTDDIKWADVIVISDGKGVNGQSAYTLYKYANPKKSLPDINNIGKPELTKFSDVLLIYDRVVAKEDVAILVDADQNLMGGSVDTNLKKLVAMLFMVNNQTINGGKGGTGRKVFMDYIKSYVNDWTAPSQRIDACSNSYNKLKEPNGYMFQDFPREKVNGKTNDHARCYYNLNNQKVYEDSYFSNIRSNTTDYLYIDEATGKFMVDKKYAGRVFFTDYDNAEGSFVHRFISWNSLYNKWNNSNKWPWEIDGEGCLKQWWFGDGVTDQGCHTPLYYHYYAWDNMRAINNPVYATYKNQSYTAHNSIFKGDYLKDAINQREVKREYTDPTHVLKKESTKYFYLSVNIENGDGVNKSEHGNKVLYINDYEMSNSSFTDIPINFVVKSSENISKIEVFKKTGTVVSPILTSILSYSPPDPDTNDITDFNSNLSFSGSSPLSLTPGDSVEPTPDSDHHNLLIYTYSGSIAHDLKKDPYFKTGTNNKFVLRVYVRPDKYVDDEICVVKRGFFDLE